MPRLTKRSTGWLVTTLLLVVAAVLAVQQIGPTVSPDGKPGKSSRNKSGAQYNAAAGTTCPQYLVIGVRGSEEEYTDEPEFRMGTRVGSFVKEAAKFLPSRTEGGAGTQYISLEYPAKLGLSAPGKGYELSKNAGVDKLAQTLNDYRTRCAGTSIGLIGYSQGANVISDALRDKVDDSVTSMVTSVLLIADPYSRGSEAPYRVLLSETGEPLTSRESKGSGMLGAKLLPESVHKRTTELCRRDDPVCNAEEEFLGLPLPKQLQAGIYSAGHESYQELGGEAFHKKWAESFVRRLKLDNTGGDRSEAFTIRARNGWATTDCLDADENTIEKNGGKVLVLPCNGRDNQKWRLLPVGGQGASTYYIQSVRSGKCLDVEYHDGGPAGSPAQMYDCNDGISEQWTRSGTPGNYTFLNERVPADGTGKKALEQGKPPAALTPEAAYVNNAQSDNDDQRWNITLAD
ncbi:RICIN domain-containing protein [Streptomyces sp. 8N114]|uniref:RICIN domain-containing protein n=1 Tax=Streptomyces sp. 8N114 TaxID=3457419 RepID=UPI003FCF8920